MTKIKLLSDSTINRIAAGEVVERPASVVKELVENAIDAGSTDISITLEQAGKNLVRISDNGKGMSPEDLELAIQRHTTSKLDENDLLNINSFGFRGEALPSIASVSKFTIISKERGSDKAYQIQLIGGKEQRLKPTIHTEGTTIEVRDLFFSTPARLKFLRTDKTELLAITSMVKKLALAHPSIAFSLSHDGKELLKLRKQSELKERIKDILGQDFVENSAIVELTHDQLAITGYASLPTFSRASNEDQFLFINNRPVKDKVITAAVKVAYQDYLARDRHCVTALFLNINPQLVDVNVHPAKSEVRFYDPGLVRGLLIKAIKNALSSVSHKVSTTHATTALGFFNTNTYKPSYNTNNSYNQAKESSSGFTNLSPRLQEKVAREYASVGSLADSSYRKTLGSSIAELIPTMPSAKTEHAIKSESGFDEEYPLGAAKTQVHSTYIISQTKDSIVIVDQHAAHERLGYEKIKQLIEAQGLVKQRLLIPEIVELPDEARAEVLHDNKENLAKMSLVIEKFGSNSIIVSELPSLIADINIAQLIKDLADNLLDMGESIALTELIEHVTETYACHYSVRAGRNLSISEMNDLLRQMEKTPFSGQCNHGRPTYVELKRTDIEKLFGRR